MPVTVLRAAVIVGHGGISWEITRQLVDHLPLLLTPNWVKTRTQPIAIDDVVRYLVGVLDPVETLGQTYEIGGPDVLRYIDMLQRAAAVKHKSLPNFTVPALTPRLVVGLAGARDRRRSADGPQPGRFDDDRGGRARPFDRADRARRDYRIRGRGAFGLGRACAR